MYRAKIKKMSGKSVHLMQLLYTPFRDLSSEISIKMVDFSKKVPFSTVFSSNRPSFPRVPGSFPADYHVVPGLFSRSSGLMYRSQKGVKTTKLEAFCRIGPFPYIGIMGPSPRKRWQAAGKAFGPRWLVSAPNEENWSSNPIFFAGTACFLRREGV